MRIGQSAWSGTRGILRQTSQERQNRTSYISARALYVICILLFYISIALVCTWLCVRSCVWGFRRISKSGKSVLNVTVCYLKCVYSTVYLISMLEWDFDNKCVENRIGQRRATHSKLNCKSVCLYAWHIEYNMLLLTLIRTYSLMNKYLDICK